MWFESFSSGEVLPQSEDWEGEGIWVRQTSETEAAGEKLRSCFSAALNVDSIEGKVVATVAY